MDHDFGSWIMVADHGSWFWIMDNASGSWSMDLAHGTWSWIMLMDHGSWFLSTCSWAPWGPFGGPFCNLGYFKQFLKIFLKGYLRIFDDIYETKMKKSSCEKNKLTFLKKEKMS